jgi:FixJ family two-component response regulator
MAALVAIVDDDEAILIGLSSLVRSAGYRVRLYRSAEAFLADAGEPAPDCVLTDVQMPGMNGLELQAELMRGRPALPVIFMTAFPEAAIREKALRGGAREFLHKPFEAETILQVLATAVAG